jgi:hypothetical protein
MQRPTRPRIPHEDAAALVEDVLRRLDAATPHLRPVERLVVFGSFAYGLLDVDDVDLAIDYEGVDMPDRAALEAAAPPLDKALAALEKHESQLQTDSRKDARELADDLKTLRQQLEETVSPVSAYLASLRDRHPPPAAPRTVSDERLQQLAADLQLAYNEWADAFAKRLSFPAGTPSVLAAGSSRCWML